MFAFNLWRKTDKWFYFALFITLFLLMLAFNKYPAEPKRAKNSLERKTIAQIIAAKPININSANERELSKLNGVGAKRAKAIIAYRSQHGIFTNFSELKKVPGLNANFLKDNKDLITLHDLS